jgi:hypothetical protein
MPSGPPRVPRRAAARLGRGRCCLGELPRNSSRAPRRTNNRRPRPPVAPEYRGRLPPPAARRERCLVMPAPAPPTGDLEREQAYLDHARAELARMRTSAEQLDASRASDAISGEVLGRVLARRIASLQDDPRTTLFFGRIDLDPPHGPTEQFHIGRRHVSDQAGDPVVIDWRAPISRAFYRASPRTAWTSCCGVASGSTAAGSPPSRTSTSSPPTPRRPRPPPAPPAPSSRPRSSAPHRPDARHRLDDPARAGRDRARRAHRQHLRAGSARHRQDRGRPAPGSLAPLLLP